LTGGSATIALWRGMPAYYKWRAENLSRESYFQTEQSVAKLRRAGAQVEKGI